MGFTITRKGDQLTFSLDVDSQQNCQKIIQQIEQIIATFLHCEPHKEVIIDNLISRGMTMVGAYSLYHQCLGRLLEGPIEAKTFNQMMIRVCEREGVR